MISSFFRTVVVFLVIGPFVGLVGVLVIATIVGAMEGDPGVALTSKVFSFGVLLFTYLSGFYPALISGVSNWLVLILCKVKNVAAYYWLAIITGSILSFLPTYYSSMNLIDFNLNFITIFIQSHLAPTWVCAHIVNKSSWRILNQLIQCPKKDPLT